MPSEKPRVNLTISHELDLVLTDYADALGVPKAKAVADVLEMTAMNLSATAKALRRAKNDPLGSLKDYLAETMAEMANGHQRLSVEVHGAIQDAEAKSKRKPVTRSKRKKSA